MALFALFFSHGRMIFSTLRFTYFALTPTTIYHETCRFLAAAATDQRDTICLFFTGWGLGTAQPCAAAAAALTRSFPPGQLTRLGSEPRSTGEDVCSQPLPPPPTRLLARLNPRSDLSPPFAVRQPPAEKVIRQSSSLSLLLAERPDECRTLCKCRTQTHHKG